LELGICLEFGICDFLSVRHLPYTDCLFTVIMIPMNYFLSNLFRDKMLWAVLGLAALAGLLIMDVITFMLMPRAVFDLWTVKITAGAAVVGAIVYGIFLFKREKKDRRLDALLPGFIEQRRGEFEKKAAGNHDFQTFCHECRHFDLNRLRCLLVLRDRMVRIRLDDDSPCRYCLYWNLEEGHPLLRLTKKLRNEKDDGGTSAEDQIERV
jgi:hypothetical protein